MKKIWICVHDDAFHVTPSVPVVLEDLKAIDVQQADDRGTLLRFILLQRQSIETCLEKIHLTDFNISKGIQAIWLEMVDVEAILYLWCAAKLWPQGGAI